MDWQQGFEDGQEMMVHPALDKNCSDPLHQWFELSYAQYLTIPRSALQSMPLPWRRKMAECLVALDDLIDWRPKDDQVYRCTLHSPNYDKDCEEASELEYWGPSLHDPLADYERGRRKLPIRSIEV